MKISDYLYLAKLNIKKRSNKKLNIVLSITLSIITLLSFVALSFKYSLTNEIYNVKDLRTTSIKMSNSSCKYYEDDDKVIVNAIKYDYIDDLKNIKGVSDYILMKQFYFKNKSFYDKFIIDDKEFIINKKIKYNHNEDLIWPERLLFDVIDMNNTSNLFLQTDYDFSENVLISGDVFSRKSMGEIMLSSLFFEIFNLNPNDYIGKNISLKIHCSYTDNYCDFIESPNEYYNQYIDVMTDFKIVGVFDYKIYSSETRLTEAENNSIPQEEPLFWITNESISIDNSLCMPQYENDKFFYENTFTTMIEYCKNNNKLFIPLGYLATHANKEYNYYDTNDGMFLLTFKDFKSIFEANSILEDYFYKSVSSNKYISILEFYQKSLFNRYSYFYSIYNLVLYITIIIVLISSILCILNLFNMMYHYIEKQKKYYGMLQTMGMERKNIFKELFTEISYTFLKSLIISFIVGFIGSIVITIFMNNIFEIEYLNSLSIDLHINIGYFFIAFIIVFIVTYLLSLLMTFILSLSFKTKEIVKYLN